MSRKSNTQKIEELKRVQEELRKDNENREWEAKKAKLPALLQLAMAAMNANRVKTWAKNHGPVDDAKKAEINKNIEETQKAFEKSFREIASNDPRIRNWWGAELQKAYVQGAPEALLIYYLSDNPNTKPRAFALKNAADEYVRGWELLGKKNRKELPGPIEVRGNGALAVQLLIEQLKAGDAIQKAQAEIVEILFEDPISNLGKPVAAEPKTEGFVLGEVAGPEETDK